MISVIIPAYNASTTIVDCINSVLNQTQIGLIEEVIVVDDGSTDNTINTIESQVNSPIVKIISKDNGGVASARNIGINNSSAEWIALLDSDDTWDVHKIEKQISVIRKHPEICFIGTNRNHEQVRIGECIGDNVYKLTLRNILFKNWPHTSTVLIKRQVFDDVGLFDESMRYAEDGNLWNRIVVKYPLFYIAESLEIAGAFKHQYGDTGLSSNLKGMYKGNVKNLSDLKANKDIGFCEYVFWRLFFWLKHIRRLLTTSFRRTLRT